MLDEQESKGSLIFNENSSESAQSEVAAGVRVNFRGAHVLALADTVTGFFHRSCGKACGKAALGSYKFLNILYF